MAEQYDIIIAGAGFAGSITALALHNIGFKVCLVEKGSHPRFAIGESSTPVADMILRELSAKYNMPWLRDFSRYGSWQKAHPDVICGIKRGFSYFKHYPGQPFTTDANHANELLVAASIDDTQSDTNWLRADFDSFVVSKVKEAGIAYNDLTEIVSAQKTEQWVFETIHSNKPLQLKASFFIDATGSGNLLEKIANIPSQSDAFLTDSYGVFSHFTNVARWVDILHAKNIPTDDFPYDPDNSALHQLLDEGWIWMLRFKTDLISIGFALNGQEKEIAGMGAEDIWQYMCEKYPSVNEMISSAILANQPGKIIKSNRLQRKLANCFGDGWVALPHTCGFVDPLFSSGIAHSLAGVEKVVAAFQQHWGNENLLQKGLQEYETAIFAELKLTDILVAGCYKTMKHFPLFNAWSMLYFAATIIYEQRRLRGEKPGYFLSADDAYVLQIVQQSYADLIVILQKGKPAPEDEQQFTRVIRERIKPINNAGLMEPASKNMYRHTTAVL